jgi:hypothetical protein
MRKLILVFTLILLPLGKSIFAQKVIVCTGNYAYSWHFSRLCHGLSNCKGEIYDVDIYYAINSLNRRGCCICTSDQNCKSDRSYQGYEITPFEPDWEFLQYAQQALTERYKQNAAIIVEKRNAIILRLELARSLSRYHNFDIQNRWNKVENDLKTFKADKNIKKMLESDLTQPQNMKWLTDAFERWDKYAEELIKESLKIAEFNISEIEKIRKWHSTITTNKKIPDGWHRVILTDLEGFYVDGHKVHVRGGKIIEQTLDNFTCTNLPKPASIYKLKAEIASTESIKFYVFFRELFHSKSFVSSPPDRAGKVIFTANSEKEIGSKIKFHNEWLGTIKERCIRSDKIPNCEYQSILNTSQRPGIYTYQIVHNNGELQDGKVEIKSGQCSEVVVKQDPLGFIKFWSDYKKYDHLWIYIDDVYWGSLSVFYNTEPALIPHKAKVIPGEHKIIVKGKNGMIIWEKTVHISDGETVTVPFFKKDRLK